MDMRAGQRLNDAVTAVCPIDGIAVGRWDDRSTWRLDAAATATPDQVMAALGVMQDFDLSPPAEAPPALPPVTPADIWREYERRVAARVGCTAFERVEFRVTTELIELTGYLCKLQAGHLLTLEEAERYTGLQQRSRDIADLELRADALSAVLPEDFRNDKHWNREPSP